MRSLDQKVLIRTGLMKQYERLQWFWNPYTQDATLVTRVETTKKITGCWTSDAPDLEFPSVKAGSSCVDVAYKVKPSPQAPVGPNRPPQALCGSREHYHERNLYTEMEMFESCFSIILLILPSGSFPPIRFMMPFQISGHFKSLLSPSTTAR